MEDGEGMKRKKSARKDEKGKEQKGKEHERMRKRIGKKGGTVRG